MARGLFFPGTEFLVNGMLFFRPFAHVNDAFSVGRCFRARAFARGVRLGGRWRAPVVGMEEVYVVKIRGGGQSVRSTGYGQTAANGGSLARTEVCIHIYTHGRTELNLLSVKAFAGMRNVYRSDACSEGIVLFTVPEIRQN